MSEALMKAKGQMDIKPEYMTPELSYVGSFPEPFDLTSIVVTRGTKKGYVKLIKTGQLYAPVFVGVPDPQLGSYTERNAAIRAARQWAATNGYEMSMAHVSSQTGQKLEVNLNAI